MLDQKGEQLRIKDATIRELSTQLQRHGQRLSELERRLVSRNHYIAGYSDFSLIRAFSVVKRQSTDFVASFRRFCQAVTARTIVSRSGIRRARHCFVRTLISIAAMFNQEPGFGV